MKYQTNNKDLILSPKVSDTQNDVTVPDEAVLGMGIPLDVRLAYGS